MGQKEKLLTFLRDKVIYIVPYFQRGYVWSKDSWDGIWQECEEICSEGRRQ